MISAMATPSTVSMLTPTTVNRVVFQNAFQKPAPAPAPVTASM